MFVCGRGVVFGRAAKKGRVCGEGGGEGGGGDPMLR